MILATSDGPTMIGGDPTASLGVPPKAAQPPLTEEEIREYQQIKCCVCGETVAPESIAQHSRRCVLEPAPNLRLQLDKWCIASAGMTPAEQRSFLHLRRTQELEHIENCEADMAKRAPHFWWLNGKFGFIISSKWLRSWRSFVGVGRPEVNTRDRPPGPINNLDLFGLDGSIRQDICEGVQQDYHVLEQPVWEFYCRIYGGGPAVLRYNTSGALPALSDTAGVFEGDWRDLRPDTGAGRVFDPYSGDGFDGELRGGFLWEGQGKGLLKSGSHYEGPLRSGLPHGEGGREVLPCGTAREGTFKEGKLHGFGRVTEAMGDVQEGEWEDGELMGI